MRVPEMPTTIFALPVSQTTDSLQSGPLDAACSRLGWNEPRARRPEETMPPSFCCQAARPDPAGCCFADDLQLGSFRRAVEMMRATGDGFALRQPTWYLRSGL